MRRSNSLCRHFSRTTGVRLMLVLALTGLSTNSLAQVRNITAAEKALLPHFCAYTVYDGPPADRAATIAWTNSVGGDNGGLHHYCWGLINKQRALRSGTPARTRQFLLGTVIDDYGYVIQKAPRNFVLLPEIHTAIGEVQLLLGRPDEANRALATARALKPDYWPAYTHWADFLIRVGQTAEAKKLVKTGLEYSPNSKLLREQYRQLGGKPSEIVPKVQANPPEDAASEIADPLVSEELSE